MVRKMNISTMSFWYWKSNNTLVARSYKQSANIGTSTSYKLPSNHPVYWHPMRAVESKLSTISEFIYIQSKCDLCKQMKQPINTSNCHFILKKTEFLVIQAPFDELTQNLLPRNAHHQALNLANHSLFAVLPDELLMYDSLWKDLHWPNMDAEIPDNSRSFLHCPRMCTLFRNQHERELLHPVSLEKSLSLTY